MLGRDIMQLLDYTIHKDLADLMQSIGYDIADIIE